MPRTLWNPATGDDVAFLQAQLNAQPAELPPLDVDGILGPITEARIREFQSDRVLPVDGVVGPLTWGALLGHATIKSPGSFVLGRNLYDRFGTKVLLRGVNKMSVFDGDDPVGLTSFAEIKQTGANTVRIVWAIATDLEPGGPATSVATLDALVANAKANRLFPLIELHDATGDWSRLNDLVAYWTDPAAVAVIKHHQEYLLVNIGNEVGDDQVSQADFIDGYTNAVQQMRAAGIHTPLVIDASNWGQSLTMLNDTAFSLLAADPDYNLIFSVHTYWSKACGFTEPLIRASFKEATDLGYPLIVGEFSKYGGFPCGFPNGTSMCSGGGEIDYAAILGICQDHQIGWYAWEWGPGNGFSDPLCDIMDMTPDRLFANLKAGWARDVAVDSPFGISNTAVTPEWL
jgi:mannan endo-1,4-beta-mannosidase